MKVIANHTGYVEIYLNFFKKILCLSILFVLIGCNTTSQEKNFYSNNAYNLQFTYPDNFVLNEYSPNKDTLSVTLVPEEEAGVKYFEGPPNKLVITVAKKAGDLQEETNQLTLEKQNSYSLTIFNQEVIVNEGTPSGIIASDTPSFIRRTSLVHKNNRYTISSTNEIDRQIFNEVVSSLK